MVLICDDYFKSTTWRLSRVDGTVLAPVLRFRDRGIVGGILSRWERVWELRGTQLLLQDISGCTTTRFEITEQDGSGVRELRGHSLVVRSIEHVLTRIEMPSLDETAIGNPDDVASIGVVKTLKKARRPNLVILRAGNSSLHRQWPRYLEDADRNWDLCISWYGAEVPSYANESEYFFHQHRDMKFPAIANLLLNYPMLMAYDNFWLPDDDLETTWKDINRLFNIFRRSMFELAQPSLSNNSNSYVNHGVTAHDPASLIRYSDFVETMCPMFARDLLKLCLPVFRGTALAYCLDHIWSGLQGRVPGRTAIIDDVVVAHSRPLGVGYHDGPQAMDEGLRLAALYSIIDSYSVRGSIARQDCIA